MVIKLVYDGILLHKAENCATNNVSQFNMSNTREVSFFEFGSKPQAFS